MRSGRGFDPGGHYCRWKQLQLLKDQFWNSIEGQERKLDNGIGSQLSSVGNVVREGLWLNNGFRLRWVRLQSFALCVQPQVRSQRFRMSFCVKSSSPAADELQRLCREGQLDQALDILDQEGNSFMYKVFFKACNKNKALAYVNQALAYLAREGQVLAGSLGDSVVSTLARCGGLEDALRVFSSFRRKSIYSWTAIISGYTLCGQGEAGLKIYHWMKEEGVQPNSYTIVSLLKACGTTSDLERGKFVHREALKYGYEADLYVGTCLVDMYARCGNIVDAQAAFDGLPHRDVVSWNVMIASYLKHRQAEMALGLYDQMKNEETSPNDRTFVSALQACAMLAEKDRNVVGDGRCWKTIALHKGNEIYADAKKKRCHSDVFVGSTVVSMYGKIGSIVDAQHVFDELPYRNVVSWNAILAAYAQQGQAEKTLQLYEQMCREGVSPDERSLVCALQACSMLAEKETLLFADGRSTKARSLEKGSRLHADARKKGYHEDVFVTSTLITMYGKCGSIVDAEQVFRSGSQRNSVSWAAMLAAYVAEGEAFAQRAWQLYEEMKCRGISVGDWAIVSVLQACSTLAESEVGSKFHEQATKFGTIAKVKAIHVDAKKTERDLSAIVSGFLVCAYTKCGSILDAQLLFDELPDRNAMAWTSIIAANVASGKEDMALRLYECMWEEGAKPYSQTFVAVLQACSMIAVKEEYLDGLSLKTKALQKGKAVHAVVQGLGCHLDMFAGSTLVSLYGKCGSVLDAQNVFDELSERDVVAWTAMLVAYAQHGQGEAAFSLYEQMQEQGVSPDVWALVSVLQACTIVARNHADLVKTQFCNLKSLQVGRAIHAVGCWKGFEFNICFSSALIDMYGKCGSILDAENVFKGLLTPNVVAWTAMLSVYLEQGQSDKALQMYRQMEQQGLCLDEVATMSIVQACSSTGSLDLCRQIHRSFLSTATGLSPLLANTLIHAYGKCASVEDAQQLFDVLPQPDVVSWNALIAGYSRQGNYAASIQCFKDMEMVGTKPDGATFLALMSACCHSGLLDTGIGYFETMTKDHGIIPRMVHYVSMVDLLGRAGKFSELENLVSAMPMQPNLSIWLSLLSACRQYGKVSLGEQVFRSAVGLHPGHTAAYFLMSSIYAEAGLQACAEEVMDMKRNACSQKMPGQSWVGHDREAHRFPVGSSHLYGRQELIFDFLGNMCVHLHSLEQCQKFNDES